MKFCGMFFLLIGFLGVPLLAHEDDPKERDRQPPYEGPAYYRGTSAWHGVSFPSSNIILEAWLPLAEFGGNINRGNDCWGYVSPSGREYAIIGLSHGTGFVEITTPNNPQVLAVPSGPSSTWRDIKTHGNHAYAVSEGGSGIQVFDLDDIDNGNVHLVNTITEGGTSATHNVAIDTVSGFLYRCGGSGEGLRIYSLADPTTPTLVGQWPDRYVHDAQIVTFNEGPYAGKQLAFCFGGFNGGWVTPGLSILDVTDKSNILDVAHYQYPNPSYSHQGWLSPDHQYAYLNDELDEQDNNIPTTTHVLDISDPQNPVQVSTFTNGTSAIDHNLYTRDNLIFEANYRSGLRVFDATDPQAPVEVAYFDTYPDNDAARFNGLWSNYPYFPSGTIIGSDLEKGLFVWSLNLGPGSPYDLNGDGKVDLSDLLQILPQWNLCADSCSGNFTSTEGVDVLDLTTLLENMTGN